MERQSNILQLGASDSINLINPPLCSPSPQLSPEKNDCLSFRASSRCLPCHKYLLSLQHSCCLHRSLGAFQGPTRPPSLRWADRGGPAPAVPRVVENPWLITNPLVCDKMPAVLGSCNANHVSRHCIISVCGHSVFDMTADGGQA